MTTVLAAVTARLDQAIDDVRQADLDALLATAEIVTTELAERLDVSTRAENVIINNFLGERVADLHEAFAAPGAPIYGPKGLVRQCGKAIAAEIWEALLKLPAAESFDGVAREELIGRIRRQAKQIEALERELRWHRGGHQ